MLRSNLETLISMLLRALQGPVFRNPLTSLTTNVSTDGAFVLAPIADIEKACHLPRHAYYFNTHV